MVFIGQWKIMTSQPTVARLGWDFMTPVWAGLTTASAGMRRCHWDHSRIFGCYLCSTNSRSLSWVALAAGCFDVCCGWTSHLWICTYHMCLYIRIFVYVYIYISSHLWICTQWFVLTILYYINLYCIVLYYIVLYYIVLYYIVLYYIILYYIIYMYIYEDNRLQRVMMCGCIFCGSNLGHSWDHLSKWEISPTWGHFGICHSWMDMGVSFNGLPNSWMVYKL